MRHNWIEGSFNLTGAKSVLVSQCKEHNLQRAILWERGLERWHEERTMKRGSTLGKEEEEGEEEILRRVQLKGKFRRKEKKKQTTKNSSYSQQRSTIEQLRRKIYLLYRVELQLGAPNLFTKHCHQK